MNGLVKTGIFYDAFTITNLGIQMWRFIMQGLSPFSYEERPNIDAMVLLRPCEQLNDIDSRSPQHLIV